MEPVDTTRGYVHDCASVHVMGQNKQSDVLFREAVIGHACDGEREKTFDRGALCVHRGSVCMS